MLAVAAARRWYRVTSLDRRVEHEASAAMTRSRGDDSLVLRSLDLDRAVMPGAGVGSARGASWGMLGVPPPSGPDGRPMRIAQAVTEEREPISPDPVGDPGPPLTPAPVDAAARRDSILVERARSGDVTAFNDIVAVHQDFLHALVARTVPDRDQADDVTQEAFFRAWRQMGSFRGGSLRSWLARIAVNAAIDLQRARKRRPVQPYPELEDETWQPPTGEDADPEATVTRAERIHALSEALGRITPDQRAAIVLFDVEGFDYGEIAQMTGVSLGTVKSRIHRGRLALRDLLADRMELFRER